MATAKQNWLRMVGGYACLWAVLLIYAPQGLLAWWAGTGACCKSNYCPIPEHHRPSKAPAGSEHHGMECEHNAPGLAACTMSCCHDTEKVLTAPMMFLPNTAAEPAKICVVTSVAESRPQIHEKLGNKPLSPPPRFLAAG